MKKLIFALAFVLILSSYALASVPSVTMLSTQTCPACVQMQKVFDELEAKYSGKLSTQHIYLEDKPELVRQYNIRFVPTLIFKDASGKEIAQEIGYRPASEVIKIFAKAGVNI